MKSITVFRIHADGVEAWTPKAFVPCGETDAESCGLSPVDGQWLRLHVGAHTRMNVTIERKRVPPEVLKREVKKRGALIEQETGRKLGKKATKELTELVQHELLPKAFPKRTEVPVVMTGEGYLLVGSTSAADVDVVTTLVCDAWPGLSLSQLNGERPAAHVFASWVLAGAADVRGWCLGREAVLKGETGKVAITGESLDRDQFRTLVQEGRTVKSLALTYDDRVGCVLTDTLQLKKFELLDLAVEGREGHDTAADTMLLAGEVQRLLGSLMGEVLHAA